MGLRVQSVSHHDAAQLDLKVERLASQGVVAIKSHSILVHLGDDRNLASRELLGNGRRGQFRVSASLVQNMEHRVGLGELAESRDVC